MRRFTSYRHALQPRPMHAGAQTASCKAEMHHVAVRDDVFLALEPHLAGIARAGLAAERDIVVVGDGLGADEALLEIGVDHAGRLRAPWCRCVIVQARASFGPTVK